jgi:hypothetical protein
MGLDTDGLPAAAGVNILGEFHHPFEDRDVKGPGGKHAIFAVHHAKAVRVHRRQMVCHVNHWFWQGSGSVIKGNRGHEGDEATHRPTVFSNTTPEKGCYGFSREQDGCQGKQGDAYGKKKSHQGKEWPEVDVQEYFF